MAFTTLGRRFRWLVRSTDGGQVRAIWRGLVPPFVAQIVLLAGVLIVFVVVRPGRTGQAAVSLALATLVALALVLGAACGIGLVVAAHLDHRDYGEYGFGGSARWLYEFVGGVLIGLLMVVATVFYTEARGYATVALDVSWGNGTATPLLSVAVTAGMLLYVLANTVYEEVLFRGVVLLNFAEGLTARGVSPAAAAGGAALVSLAIFGVYHLVPPGSGGGITAVLTSAGLGLVFALAYLVTGELSLPIGVHFGGVFLLSIQQVDLLGLGYTLPSLVVLEFTSRTAYAPYEIVFVRAVVGISLVSLWVTLRRETPSLGDVLYAQDD